MPTAYEKLRYDLTQAHLLWRTYVALFTGNLKKADLMNETAGEFFGLFQKVLLNEIVLSLSRLADRTKKTLSFEKLFRDEQGRLSPQTKAEAQAALQEFRAACKPFENWRHNFIAHTNLKVAVGLAALGPLSGADTVKALELGVKFMRLMDPPPGMDWKYDYEYNGITRILMKAVFARRYHEEHRDKDDGHLSAALDEWNELHRLPDANA